MARGIAIANPKLTQERMREVLRYDPETGIFTSRQYRGKFSPGDVVGGLSADGYRVISIDGFKYRAARLAFFWMNGEWPEARVDHRDRTRSTDKWRNLREATPSQNSQNQSMNRRNSSGHQGVSWDSRRGKWRAFLQVEGSQHHSRHETIEQAIAARSVLKARLHTFHPSTD